METTCPEMPSHCNAPTFSDIGVEPFMGLPRTMEEQWKNKGGGGKDAHHLLVFQWRCTHGCMCVIELISKQRTRLC